MVATDNIPSRFPWHFLNCFVSFICSFVLRADEGMKDEDVACYKGNSEKYYQLISNGSCGNSQSRLGRTSELKKISKVSG